MKWLKTFTILLLFASVMTADKVGVALDLTAGYLKHHLVIPNAVAKSSLDIPDFMSLDININQYRVSLPVSFLF